MKVITAVAIVIAACVLLGAAADSAVGGMPGPTVAHERLTRPFRLADGGIVVRPTAIRFPRARNGATAAYHSTSADGVRMVESADPLLWQNTGVMRTGAMSLTAKAAYARVTVAADLRPKGALGQRTLAFVVFYRIALAGGCLTGWRLYVEPLLAPGQDSGYVGPDYIVATGGAAGCGDRDSRRSFVAYPHRSQRWHLVGRSATAATIRFERDCSPDTRIVAARHGSRERIQVILDMTTILCAQGTPRSATVAVPAGVRLVQGPLGVMPVHHVPVR